MTSRRPSTLSGVKTEKRPATWLEPVHPGAQENGIHEVTGVLSVGRPWLSGAATLWLEKPSAFRLCHVLVMYYAIRPYVFECDLIVSAGPPEVPDSVQ